MQKPELRNTEYSSLTEGTDGSLECLLKEQLLRLVCAVMKDARFFAVKPKKPCTWTTHNSPGSLCAGQYTLYITLRCPATPAGSG